MLLVSDLPCSALQFSPAINVAVLKHSKLRMHTRWEKKTCKLQDVLYWAFSTVYGCSALSRAPLNPEHASCGWLPGRTAPLCSFMENLNHYHHSLARTHTHTCITHTNTHTHILLPDAHTHTQTHTHTHTHTQTQTHAHT